MTVSLRRFRRMSVQRTCMYGVVLFLVSIMVYSWLLPCDSGDSKVRVPPEMLLGQYNKNMPLIFIGGVPRSGTTLMRAMLDAHPDVRCGEETRVIPRLLGMRTQWAKSSKESKRLIEAGLSDQVIDSALTAFILEIIVKHGEVAPRLCNKDPFTLKSTMYLARLFPNSKYLLMIRDGRAVVHSIISRKVTISGFDLRSFRNCLEKWNQAIESMFYQCLRVGPERCMPVYYEQMVLHPEEWLHRVLNFLGIQWHEAVMHHQDYVGKPGGISLSKTERSTDQVIKPVNMDALTKWVTEIPEDVKRDIHKIAPMLQRLGYDPDSYPPNYGKPDKAVADNTLFVKNNEDYWNRKLDLLNISIPSSQDSKQNVESQNMENKEKISGKVEMQNINNNDKSPEKVDFNNNEQNQMDVAVEQVDKNSKIKDVEGR